MAYQDIHTNHLNDILELIKLNKLNGSNEAIEKFGLYLDTIQSIGSFDISNWRQDWRQKIWKLGEQFKTRNPQHFLNLIDEKITSTASNNLEVLEFIKSEIIFNYLPEKECKIQIEKLINLYPLNPEFRHTLGHYYIHEKEMLKGIAEYKLALKIEPNNSIYLRSRFTNEYEFLNQLIRDGEYNTGQEYVKNIFSENFYSRYDSTYHNSFIDFQARFQDHIIFEKKVEKIESDFKEKMHTELDNERKRIIEVLGFFSAIVAFILSTVSIGKNYSFQEAIFFILSLGIILILFAVTLSILFNSNKVKLFKDKKFWVLIISLLLLLLFLLTVNNITLLISKFA